MSKQKTIADYDYPLKHTVISKDNEKAYKLLVATYGKKLVDKLAKAKVTLDAFVGASPKTCKELEGLGSVIATLRIDGRPHPLSTILTKSSNHVWLPQVRLIDGEADTISVCFNCGSIMDNGEFIDAQKEEKSKEEK